MRSASQHANRHKSQQIMDVNPQQVIARLQHYQVNAMIHGHTHRPAVHQIVAGHFSAQRAVLGAWHNEGSMIKVTEHDIELIFPFLILFTPATCRRRCFSGYATVFLTLQS